MTFDLYSDLAQKQACPTEASLPEGLVSGFVDGCTHWFWWNELQRSRIEAQAREQRDEEQKRELKEQEKEFARHKEAARQCYRWRPQAEKLQFPLKLSGVLTPQISNPLQASWLGLEVCFELETP